MFKITCLHSYTVYGLYFVCLLDQDGCQILAVLQDASGRKKKDPAGV
jgi:hypothetical protein